MSLQNISEFRVASKQQLNLRSCPTKTAPFYEDSDDYKKQLKSLQLNLEENHTKLTANGQHGVLMILQGMDAAGKDGAVKHGLSGLNPQWLNVVSFRSPTPSEQREDFLKRAHAHVPARGTIAIFNRSYYEEVVTVRVHPELLSRQKLPPHSGNTNSIFENRVSDINQFELYLTRQGIHVLKIFFHISKAEQKARLLARLEDPKKIWKFNPNDVEEREAWSKYQTLYSACLSATSTKHAPWYIVPADDKKNARLLVATLLQNKLEELKLRYPGLPKDKAQELKTAREKLLGTEV